MLNFILGILASLVAAFLWRIGTALWPQVVDQGTYKGVRAEGVWEIVATHSKEEVTAGEITLRQAGKKVTGEGVRVITRDGNPSNRKFKYEGRFAGEQLTLIFQDASGEDFDCGTDVFRMQNNGTEMVGVSTFHGKKENRIVSEKRVLRKKP